MATTDYGAFIKETLIGAGEILLSRKEGTQRFEWKMPNNFKTEADDASNEHILGRIRERFPHDGIHTEEDGSRGTSNGIEWIVDPLDGTIPFAQRLHPYWGINIARVENDHLTHGGMYLPETGNLLYAKLCHAARVFSSTDGFGEAHPLEVQAPKNLQQMVLSVDYGKRPNRATHAKFLERLLAQPNGITYPIAYASAIGGISQFVLGNSQGYFGLSFDPEDLAPGVLIAREAGAKVSNIDGERWSLEDSSVVMTHPSVHDKLLDLLCGN